MKKENRNQIKSADENGGNPDTVSPKMIQSDVHQKKKKKSYLIRTKERHNAKGFLPHGLPDFPKKN